MCSLIINKIIETIVRKLQNTKNHQINIYFQFFDFDQNLDFLEPQVSNPEALRLTAPEIRALNSFIIKSVNLRFHKFWKKKSKN